MPVTIVVGAQWGDEGKGKIVDMLAQSSHMVVRYNGGNNAGHSIMNEYGEFVLHLIPAGIFNPETYCVIERGVVIHPPSLADEMNALQERGISLKRLVISPDSHLVMPWHIAEDRGNEGDVPIGTTLRGIGPCYKDKVGRWQALRMGDLLYKTDFLKRLDVICAQKRSELTIRFPNNGNDFPVLEDIRRSYMDATEKIVPYIKDTSALIRQNLAHKKQILLEGAQGTLLDVDYGTYPYVTSSNTTSMAACLLTGISPRDVERIIGVAKAYITRVGDGPFPTEMKGKQQEELRKTGREYGATTGRPRRCGWLDLPLLRYSAEVNHLTEIALTKLDVLGTLRRIKICAAYGDSPHLLGSMDIRNLQNKKLRYQHLYDGWGDLNGIRFRDELPEQAGIYIKTIEEDVGVPIRYISIGGKRKEIISL